MHVYAFVVFKMYVLLIKFNIYIYAYYKHSFLKYINVTVYNVLCIHYTYFLKKKWLKYICKIIIY